MDTSETYIKMRLKAIPELGRGVAIPLKEITPVTQIGHLDGRIYDVVTDDVGNWYCHYSDGQGNMQGSQLERQDQLQEMVINRATTNINCEMVSLLGSLYEGFLCGNKMGDFLIKFTSMEQLWLAFVMKEKYNKTWDGENWINQMPCGRGL